MVTRQRIMFQLTGDVMLLFSAVLCSPYQGHSNDQVRRLQWSHLVGRRSNQSSSPRYSKSPGCHQSFSKDCRCWWWKCSWAEKVNFSLQILFIDLFLPSFHCRFDKQAMNKHRSLVFPSDWASIQTLDIPCPCHWDESSNRPAWHSQCPNWQRSLRLPRKLSEFRPEDKYRTLCCPT